MDDPVGDPHSDGSDGDDRPTVSRRRLLIGSAAVAVATVSGGVVRRLASGTANGSDVERGRRLSAPSTEVSTGGRLEVELRASTNARLPDGTVTAYGFNGSSPGPTLVVSPGDSLAVRLVNDLDEDTSLHTHGLRVDPSDNGDNPFVRVRPGTTFDYEFLIPQDHPAGTYWYHPHAHGNVARQVFGGLVGAIVVDDGTDPAVDEDRVLVVTDTTLNDDAGERMDGRIGATVLVNGLGAPVLQLRAGSVERWRVVNATASRMLPLSVEGVDGSVVAVDGAWLDDVAVASGWVLAPGNRADLIVTTTGSAGGRLLAAAYDPGGMPMMGSSSVDGAVLLSVAVDGDQEQPSPVPARPAAIVVETLTDAVDRELVFDMGMGDGMMGGGMTHTIDGREFDPDRDDIVVETGATERWRISNTSSVAHPFHLHVWPMVVVATSGGVPVTGTHQDVVNVPAGGWVEVEIEFSGQTGRTVYHCHILDHEDDGMMGTVVVE